MANEKTGTTKKKGIGFASDTSEKKRMAVQTATKPKASKIVKAVMGGFAATSKPTDKYKGMNT